MQYSLAQVKKEVLRVFVIHELFRKDMRHSAPHGALILVATAAASVAAVPVAVAVEVTIAIPIAMHLLVGEFPHLLLIDLGSQWNALLATLGLALLSI